MTRFIKSKGEGEVKKKKIQSLRLIPRVWNGETCVSIETIIFCLAAQRYIIKEIAIFCVILTTFSTA